MKLSICVVVFLALALDFSLTQDDIPEIVPPNLRRYSDGRKYYRYLTFQSGENALYVGAMNHIYRLNADNIESRAHKSAEFMPKSEDVSKCEINHDKYEECKNHIRNIYMHEGELHVCGTGAHSPMEFTVSANLEPIGVYPPQTIASGVKKCPYGASDSYASVYVERGNPDELSALYAGSITSSVKAVIHRPALMRGDRVIARKLDTIFQREDPEWMLEGEFINSFESDNYVYFFLNEDLVLSEQLERRPMVARMCKSDTGGSVPYDILANNWATYIKAQLSCTVKIDNENSFTFTHLRDIRKVGSVYYGIFSTTLEASGSAICVYDEASINSALDTGRFAESETCGYEELAEERVPSQRPGSCVSDTERLPFGALTFIKTHPLLWERVAPRRREAVYHAADVHYTKLSARLITGKEQYVVFYLVTSAGDVHTVVSDASLARWRHVSTMRVFTSPTKVWSLVMGGDERQLYMGSDESVVQLDPVQCDQYDSCTLCVKDPHCGWDRMTNECQEYKHGSYQSVFGSAFDECLQTGACDSGPHLLAVRVPGDPINLRCDTKCLSHNRRVWYHDGMAVDADHVKHLYTRDGGLVVLNASRADQGGWECRVVVTEGGAETRLVSYQVTLPKCTDPDCIWREEYRSWCSEFDHYRKEYNKWQCVKNECINNNNCEPREIESQQCSGP